MRELFLHVGLHKTGTTYLQKLMLANRDRLLAAGYGLGPHINPRTGAHHPMVEAMAARGPEAVFAEAAAAPGERLIVSSENFSKLLLDPARAAAVAGAAARHFAIRVVIFVRRQDLLKESVFSQIVKNWYEGRIEDDRHYSYDHDARVRGLEAAFGPDRVRVLLYRDEGPRDVAGDFFRAIGLRLDPAGLDPVGRQNVSLHRRKVLFLSQVPKAPLAAIEADPRHLVLPQLIAGVVADSQAVADDGGRFLLPPAARRALVAAHLEGNRALVARHGLPDSGFFLSLPPAEEPWRPPAPITRSEVAAVWREVVASVWARHNPVRAARIGARTSLIIARMARRVPAAPGLGAKAGS